MQDRYTGDAGGTAKCGLPRAGEERTVSEPIPSARDAPASMRAAGFESDPVVEVYKRDIDRTLLRQNLRRSVTERVANLMALQRLAVEAGRAGRARERDS